MEAKGKRNIQSGSRYNRYFPSIGSLKGTDPIVTKSNTVFRTLEVMKQIVHSTLPQTKKIAQKLKGKNLHETTKNIFDFVYKHIQYEIDNPQREQLREPLRLWKDKKGDCDCFSIFISSILTNLGIEHYFRMTKYADKWQHVYVIVPKKPGLPVDKRQNYYVIDPVTDFSNYEVPFKQKFDKKMSKLQILNGIPGSSSLGYTPTGISGFGSEFQGLGDVTGLGTLQTAKSLEEDFNNRFKRHLTNMLNILKANPNASGLHDSHHIIKGLNQLLPVWDNPVLREQALDKLAQLELAHESLNGLGGFFKKLFRGVKKVVKKVGNAVKKGAKAVGKVVKGVGKIILKLNPVSIAARAGLRAALRGNLFGMSGRLGWGYFSESQAMSLGVSRSDWQQHNKALHKIRGIYEDGLQGKASKLREVILRGFEKSGNSPIPIHEIGKQGGVVQSLQPVKNTENLTTLVGNPRDLSVIKPINPVFHRPAVVRPAGPFILPHFRQVSGLGDLGVEPASTAAASGIIAKIVVILKKLNPIKLIKKGINALKNKKADKELEIKNIMADFGVSRAEAEKIYREEQQRRKGLERQLNKEQRQLDRQARGGSIFQRLLSKAKGNPAVQKLAEDPSRFLSERKQLLNKVIKGGSVQELENGKILVEAADGETILTDASNLQMDEQGNTYVTNGARVGNTGGQQLTAGFSPFLGIGIALAVGGMILNSGKKDEKKKT